MQIKQGRKILWFFPIMLSLACSAATIGLDKQADEPQTEAPLATETIVVTEQLSIAATPETKLLCDLEETEFDSTKFNSTGGRRIVLDNPAMVPASEATWLEAGTLVMGVEQNGEAHAYPVFQMIYPHIANTEIGGQPYLVTY